MAEHKQEKRIGFKTVQLFKHQILGIGSYGKVCRAECDGLLCAAKVIHETLFDPNAQSAPQREHRLPMRRFEQECEFLSTVRHPNIIQYLGVYQDPDTHFPLILMELMDDSLTHYLESSIKPVPYHVQINVCHDITLALTFLHSNGIVHRDLSSNNVLVVGNIRAKVTDFGMARLEDFNPRATCLTFTMCPGTDVYMPPEAVKDKPVYTEKIDCFSFGVIAVQIMTQLFPQPGDRRKEIEIEHVGLVEKRISECERRQNHISKIDPNCPLLTIALKCLKDKDVDRPSACELCRGVAALKRSLEYSESVSIAIENCTQEPGNSEQRRESMSLHQYVEQIENLKSQIESLEATIQQKNMVLAAKHQEIEQLREQNEEKAQLRGREKERESNKELARRQEEEVDKQVRSSLQQPRAQCLSSTNKESEPTIKLQWKEGIEAPCKMSRYFSGVIDAAVDGNVVYVMEGTEIYAYTASTCTWSRLPNYNFTNCSSAIVNNLLTLIGGVFDDRIIDKLFSLTSRGEATEWTEEFPPMPTKRWGASAICIKTALIVAGGQGDKAEIDLLTTIEVMNTQTHHWSRTAADLPQPALNATLVCVKGYVFVLGGYDKDIDPIKSVYRCSLSSLLRPLTSGSLRVPLAPFNKTSVWNKITDIPVERSTYLIFYDKILSIGGVDSHSRSITDIHVYNVSTNAWEVISHMTLPRQMCFAAILPENRLIVMGGETETGRKTSAVEIATFL